MWHKSITSINLNDRCWSWLTQSGSLTKFLAQQAGKEDLIIKLLGQHWRSPSQDEKKRLNITNDNKGLERKIVMLVMNKPWLFARTFFTAHASEILGDDLRNLASNSLGALIDKYYPLITRGTFEYSLLDKDNFLYNELMNSLLQNNHNINTANYIMRNKLIIRRSLFFYNDPKNQNIIDKPVLFNIDEVFLPDLVNKMLNLEVVV